MAMQTFVKGALWGAAGIFATGYMLHRRRQLQPLMEKVDEKVEMGQEQFEDTMHGIRQGKEKLESEIKSRTKRSKEDAQELAEDARKLKEDMMGDTRSDYPASEGVMSPHSLT